MNDIEALAPRFHALFAGLETARGKYNNLQPPNEDGKIIGLDRSTLLETITDETWVQHLSGVSGLGVVVIRHDSTAVFGAIDVDIYDGFDHFTLAKRLDALKLPLVACRSKSGGCHVYLFAKEPVPAAHMVRKLKEIAAFLGHGGSEIFPKQTQVIDNPDKGDMGSWLNVPYFNGMRGLRFAIRPDDGGPMEPLEFLLYAESQKQNPDWFVKPLIVSVDLPQGPPCLQHLVQLTFPPGTRNNGLYGLGVYAKKSDPDNYATLIEEYNRKFMNPPLEASEVLTITKSLKRKDYQYKCNEQPLASHCNAALCRTRKFGVGSGTQKLPEIGRLSKLNTSPPIWFVEVDGRRIELTTPELQDPTAFQTKCMDELNMMPPIAKKQDWQVLISTLMVDIDVIPAPEDSSAEGQFWDLLERFCTGRAMANKRDEILLGKPFVENGKAMFQLFDLRAYLERNRFKKLEDNKIINILKSRGGTVEYMKMRGLGRNVWSIPAFAAQTEGHEVPEIIAKDQPNF